MDLKDHELISILRTLSLEDISSIRIMLNSKFFNNRKIAEEIFERIVQFQPDYDCPEFTDKSIIKSISKNKIYDDVTFRVAISIILKTTEKYLILKELDDDPFYKDYFLTTNHFKNNRLHLIRKNLSSMKKIINDTENPVIDKNKKLFYYLVDELNLLLSEGAFNKSFKSNIVFEKYLEVFIQFTNYFVHTMTNNYMSFDMYSRIKPVNAIKNKIDKLIKDLNFTRILRNLNKEDKFFGLTELKINLLNAFSNMDDTEHYFTLKKNINKHYELLSGRDKYIYFGKLISYCLLKTFEDSDEGFKKEFFLVCKEYTENKIFRFGPIPLINITSFRTTFLAAMENDELKWAEKFLKENYREAPKEYHKDILNFYSAVIEFYKGNYSGILEKLITVENDAFYNDIRQLKILTYFKLGYIDDMKQEIRTFSKYLKTNTSLNQRLKKDINTFLKLLNILAENTKDTKSIIAFERRLKKEKYFRYKRTMLHMLKMPEASLRQAVN